MSRMILVLSLLSLAACSTGATTSARVREPGASVGSLSFGREGGTPSAEKAYVAPVREARAVQHVREPRAFRLECWSCSR